MMTNYIFTNNVPDDISGITLQGEEWRTFSNGRYAVSSFGRVVSFYFKDTYRLLMMTQREYAGYLRVHLHINGKTKLVSVHRLVAGAFVPNIDCMPEVNHKDGNKHNNRADNLEWVTKSQNKRHSIDVLCRLHPLQGRKLNESAVFREVVQYSSDGRLLNTYHSIRVASIETGVNETNISRCANGKRMTAGGFVWKFK